MKWHLEGGRRGGAPGGERSSDALRSQQAQFGRANPCPNCGSPGFLDHLDIIDRIQYEHCPECGHEWSQTEEEVSQV